MKQLKWPISLFSLCAVESFQLRRAEFDENSENLNAFFSMFSNGMTYFEGYHVKADVLRIPKKWYFLRFRGFKPELLLPKVRSFSKYCFWKVSALKKSHGHNFDLRASPLNQSGANRYGVSLIQWWNPQIKIVAVGFFFDTAYFWWQIENFRVVWLWAPITPFQKL